VVSSAASPASVAAAALAAAVERLPEWLPQLFRDLVALLKQEAAWSSQVRCPFVLAAQWGVAVVPSCLRL
jgi:hypothetical protein